MGLLFSNSGRKVWVHELGSEPDYPYKIWDNQDFRAPFASGSAKWDAMVVVPCSTGGLSRISLGISDNLIGRTADVMLKERRKLMLVVRETPLSLTALENMVRVTQAGGIVMPACPAFYTNPQTLTAAVDTVVGRVLDQLDIAHTRMPRWGEGDTTKGL